MDDREVVAAIAAGDPEGIAMAYDKYAAALYGYCYWLLRHPATAAEAMRDTFVVAVATLNDLPETPELRPWLYALARRECLSRLRMTSAFRAMQADPADQPADADGESGPTSWQTLVSGILADSKPREREAIELIFRHDLHGADLAITLGVSRRRAHELESRAQHQLEKNLGVMATAHAGREACPALDALLAGWDGQWTKQAHDLVGGHIEQCEVCAGRGRDVISEAILSGQPAPPALPPLLRQQVLRLSSSRLRDARAYRRRVARRAEAMWLAIRLMRGGSIRGNLGAAMATVVVVVWLVVAVSVTWLTFANSHPAHSLSARPSVSTSTSSPAIPTPTAADPAPDPATSSPSLSISQSPTAAPPPVIPSVAGTERYNPSPSSSPSRSPSPSPSRSPSPSSSPSRSSSPSPTPSSSKSTTPSASPSASRSPAKAGRRESLGGLIPATAFGLFSAAGVATSSRSRRRTR